MKETSDEDILNLLLQEHTYQKGFSLLMVKYREQLYRHIRRIVIIHDDADDVIQNTFIKVYKSIDRFEGKSKLYTWLYRIATNEAITFINSKNKKETADIDDPDQAYLGASLKADEWFDGDDIQLRLQKAIITLPDKQRIVFNMRYFEETPYEEMSKILDTSVGALKASYHHAVKKVEAYFSEKDE